MISIRIIFVHIITKFTFVALFSVSYQKPFLYNNHYLLSLPSFGVSLSTLVFLFSWSRFSDDAPASILSLLPFSEASKYPSLSSPFFCILTRWLISSASCSGDLMSTRTSSLDTPEVVCFSPRVRLIWYNENYNDFDRLQLN